MYVYYLIKVEFADGEWGYVKSCYSSIELTQVEGYAMPFSERRDAENFFYDVVKYARRSDGAAVTRVFITTITSENRL